MQVGTLYVVATPIGNLDDISARALRILREVDLIAAEDTRRTAKLLNRFGIKARVISFHGHSSRHRLSSLVERMRAGQSVALVSDAGTPGISDPGVELVRAAIAADVRVDPIPGPSAPIAAAVSSGFDLEQITIFGFAPHRSRDRNCFITDICSVPWVVVFLESPLRIRDTLKLMSTILADRPIVVARELTKAHQEFLRGTSQTVLDQLQITKGEFTVVVGKANVINKLEVDEKAVYDDFCHYAKNASAGRRDLVRLVARKHGTSINNVYRIIEANKTLGPSAN